ncbi:MAG: trypsin-like serine peptidase [Thiolinea sp.]
MNKHLIIWRVLFLLIAGLSWLTPVSAKPPLLVVPAEVFQPDNTQTPPASRLRAASESSLTMARRNSRPMSMELGAPNDAELATIQTENSRYKALQIGIKRQVPTLPAAADWVWTPVSGGQAGQFLIVSDQASRLRALLRLPAALPDGVEIRIYTPDDDQSVHGPFTRDSFQADDNSNGAPYELWTPTVSGTTLGIEIFAPDGVDTTDINVGVPTISHIVYDLQSGQFKNISTHKLNSCDVSIACAPGAWQDTAKAVARYIYTASDGNSYLCSGTLINDQNSATQEPYFITAAHCVSDTNSAASMDFFWLYRESSCGADDAVWTQVSGGAELLVSRVELDTTLVRMNNLPPSGVTISGWMLETFTDDETATGIHHALGDMKQFSNGQFNSYTDINLVEGGYTATQNPEGDFAQVIWSTGITAPGSSGSGLWKTVNAQHFLKGTLVGGSSSCAAPDSPDEYSRLERFYPFTTAWLGAPPLQSILDQQNDPQPLTDGIMLARYMNGVRGNALLSGITTENVDIATIESRLQDAVNNLDIDENGTTEGNRDGLLFIRYLLGLRGNSLVADIDLTASPNNTPAGITTAIEAVLAGE